MILSPIHFLCLLVFLVAIPPFPFFVSFAFVVVRKTNHLLLSVFGLCKSVAHFPYLPREFPGPQSLSVTKSMFAYAPRDLPKCSIFPLI